MFSAEKDTKERRGGGHTVLINVYTTHSNSQGRRYIIRSFKLHSGHRGQLETRDDWR